MARKKSGRPTKFTAEVVRKIEEVAALDGTVEEMAYYADVNPDTIYDWLKTKPEFSERIKALRQRPILKARQTINKRMEESYGNAVDYLKRKKRSEFGDNVDMTSGGDKIAPMLVKFIGDEETNDS